MNSIVQLKPGSESFYEITLRRLKELKALVLCEGKTEVEAFKAVTRRLGLELPSPIGVTDCEGIDKLYDIAGILAVLARLYRRLKAIGVLLDAEDKTPQQRYRSLLDSLNARGLRVEEQGQACSHVYEALIASEPRTIPLVVAVSGLQEYPYPRHTIHDHAVKLAVLEGRLDEGQLRTASSAEELIDREDLVKLVEEASQYNLREAFNHLHCLAQTLASLVALRALSTRSLST